MMTARQLREVADNINSESVKFRRIMHIIDMSASEGNYDTVVHIHHEENINKLKVLGFKVEKIGSDDNNSYMVKW